MPILITATGPTQLRSYVFPDANATMLTSANAVTAAQGGTGFTSYTVGDLLYASGAAALSQLSDVAVGQVLVSNGVGVAPGYSASPSVTKLLVGDGTHLLPSQTYASEPSSGWYRNAASDVRLSVITVDRLIVSPAGTYITGPDGAQYFIFQNGELFLNATKLTFGSGAADAGISRLGAASFALGTNTGGDFSGGLKLTNLTLARAATLLTTSVALTDVSGAGAGTLSNAPTAGNPTKWFAINDNGVTRKVPTWT